MMMVPLSGLLPGMVLANGDVIKSIRHGYYIGITFTDGRTVEVKDDVLIPVSSWVGCYPPPVNVS